MDPRRDTNARESEFRASRPLPLGAQERDRLVAPPVERQRTTLEILTDDLTRLRGDFGDLITRVGNAVDRASGPVPTPAVDPVRVEPEPKAHLDCINVLLDDLRAARDVLAEHVRRLERVA